MDAAASAFWDWSVDFYGEPGVEPILLDLQDRLGLDVNLLLFACWTGATGRGRLKADEWARLVRGTAPWRENVAAPLRAIRRYLKSDQPDGVRTLADSLRDRVKAAELEAERGAQCLIAAIVDAGQSGNPANAECHADALANLGNYIANAGVSLAHSERGLIERLSEVSCAFGREPSRRPDGGRKM
jgi:uncharacterized protein (TIGR02444 family)